MSLYYDFLACWNEKEVSNKGVPTELSLSLGPSPTKDIYPLDGLLSDHEDNNGVCLTLRLSPPGSSLSSGTPCSCKRKTPSWAKQSRTYKKKDDTTSPSTSKTYKCARSKGSTKREGSGVHQSPSPRAGLGEGGGDGPWVKKMLSASDVNSSSRLLLPKAEIIDRYVLPSLDEEKETACQSAMGLRVKVTDKDCDEKYELTLLQWKSGSYVLTNNWSEYFVRRRILKEGDSIELSWNAQNLEFLFRKSTN
ncbi:unnamed protein product [Cuscuta epithymum]|uniref:TF-B3 domain-containing protein n=1 Tax=Cuscuta epithymum TaxID=186058 RepID=A0AAV0F8L0_9ASTE|nr:unnamed protein product [Cuscuta epithymum]